MRLSTDLNSCAAVTHLIFECSLLKDAAFQLGHGLIVITIPGFYISKLLNHFKNVVFCFVLYYVIFDLMEPKLVELC